MLILQLKANLEENKEQEFLQAVRSIIEHPAIRKYKNTLVTSTENTRLYKVEFMFDNMAEVELFRATAEFHELAGAFQVLGEETSVTTFRSIEIDN